MLEFVFEATLRKYTEHQEAVRLRHERLLARKIQKVAAQ
jgi:hypothetical protein